MNIDKTTDHQSVVIAARIWAEATAKRDEDGRAKPDHAMEKIQGVLDSSDRSFLLVLSGPPNQGTRPGEDEGEASEESEIISFGVFEPEEDGEPAQAELRYLGVDPNHWGSGWASRLLVAAPAALRSSDFNACVLWVHADNTRAIWVYESVGWVGTGNTRRNHQTGKMMEQYRLNLS